MNVPSHNLIKNKNATLTIIGCGIKFMSHLTIEAQAAIKHADVLFYLVNEPAMRAWLQEQHANCISLESIYHRFNLREQAYQHMSLAIINALELSKGKKQAICVVLEGHPVVFAKPALEAALEAQKRGYLTRILPGISAEDYLFAELNIDPGTVGCQSYEATDFLIHQRAFDGYSHLILWQVSVIGMLENNPTHQHKTGTTVLIEHLSKHYSCEHEAILFEGSQYPHISSRIEKIALKNLPDANISRITTLYIPPAGKAICDPSMLKKLEIKNTDHTNVC